MIKYLLGILLVVFTASFSVAQSKKVYIFKGNEYFNKLDFANALLQYRLAMSDSVSNSAFVYPYEVQLTNLKLAKAKPRAKDSVKISLQQYLHHQVAWCYFNIKDYPKAEEHLKISADNNVYPHDMFYLGQASMNNRKYDDAITQFEDYIRSEYADDDLIHAAQVAMTGCHFAKGEMGKTTEVSIKKADSAIFNKGTSNFAPMYYDKDRKLMFTSAREGGVIIDEKKQQSEYICDIYYSNLNEADSSWSEPINYGRPLNSAQNDGASSFNNNGVIFYTRWSNEKREEQNIYLARILNGKFFEAYKLDTMVNYPKCRSVQPYVSMDGKWLFFSSNRPGGLGGMDIWRIAIDSVGLTVGAPENLGAIVNSDRDEGTPFFHEVSSTLFFSSNGHGSMGGLDIFKSYYEREVDAYAVPVNMGAPINSSYDDAYMVWDSRLSRGYMASDREPCPSNSCYDIYEVINEPIHIYLSGYSYNKETEEILPNVKLTFKDINGVNEPITMTTNDKGYYELELSYGQDLFIRAQKINYFADATSVSTASITQTTSIVRDFYLKPIPQKEIEIEGIEYDFNSANLRPTSKEVLDKLYDFLELNDNISVEINSHTDARGSDVYNLDLSQRRAKSCVDYLVSKGIEIERLKPVGYGETQPNEMYGPDKKPVLDENGNPVLLTEAYINKLKAKKDREALHQKNRRTAFKVTSQ
jgi:outer membrane protein OmpA-like peptidoglycan-associated protein